MALRALGFEPNTDEVQRLVREYDKGQITGDRPADAETRIDFHEFLDILITKMSVRDTAADLEAAFQQIDRDEDEMISFEDLRKVCHELGEDLSDEEIRDMINGANKGGPDGAVTM